MSQPFDFPGIASLLMRGSVRTRAIDDRFAQTGQFFVLHQGVIKAESRPAWARGLKRSWGPHSVDERTRTGEQRVRAADDISAPVVVDTPEREAG